METVPGLAVLALLGLLVGALAKFIMPGRDRGGLITTSLLGIAGAVVGGWAGPMIGLGEFSGLNATSFAAALGGALVLLLGFRVLRILF